MNKKGFRYCDVCGLKLRKNGIECQRQRWRCMSCGTSRVRRRPDVSRRIQLRSFVGILLGIQPRKDTYLKSTHLPAKYSWCWDIDPVPFVTGEIYPYIMIDAKSVGKQVVAVARTADYAIGWQFGVQENSELWSRLFKTIPRPHAIVCDGQKGIYKALCLVWPDIVIQRCLVHVRRNLRVKLTLHPQSEAGRDLAWLCARLYSVRDALAMAKFIAIFDYLYDLHSDFLNEKTYYSDQQTGRLKWWYKHRKVRGAFRQIERLITNDELFAYITQPELNLPSTTNGLEGGINARLDELLHRHRGMSQYHQMRLVQWYLDSRTEQPFLKQKNTIF